MSATSRRPVVIPDPSYETLRGVLGKLVSLADILLVSEQGGLTLANAVVAPGTSHTPSRVLVDFADAGIDQVRVVVRGNAGAAGTVQATVYDVTNAKELARVAVVDAATTTVAGEWTTIVPTGLDHEIELRVIGDGVLDPVLYRVSLQCRTLQAHP